MNSTTIPAELDSAPTPSWATTATDWEADLDGSWSRSVRRPVRSHVEVDLVQVWTRAGGFEAIGPVVHFGDLEELNSEDDVPVWREAELLADALVDVAAMLRKAASE